MKKLLLILSVCLTFACKKSGSVSIDDIAKYSWPLASATVNPALTVNGKTSTNLITTAGNDACLNNNYTLNFSSDGSYAYTSTGSLCDMISFKNAKYTKNGNEISLNSGFGNTHIVLLTGNTIVDKYTYEQDKVTYTVVYTFTAKSK
ncbi:hypothetical protein [Pedobacter mucosus]|uniref:hypothetical protein n=1 Tax=Pedobacter mucosus TaxID=2895286 RepID=UPI001EE42265|nr:hypothetical protein [Pedobacter mucosus]UKT63737.1 hypothetical protein LOK61_18455 [Pedobacter mucosus]